MQISMIKYPSINAKLKGMYAKRINKNEIKELAKQNNLKSVVAVLKNKNINLNAIDENADRQQIEKILNLEIINDLSKIVKYLDKNDTKIFNLLISKYKINCIKKAIKLIYSKNESDDNIKIWTEKIFKDLKGLENVKDFEELYKIVDDLKYKKVLKKYLEYEDSALNIFSIENQFDKNYLEGIYEIAGNKQLKNMIGIKIDFTNILWIYRMKKYYSFSEEEIKKSIVNINYKFKKINIINLIKAKDLQEMNEVLSKTVYKNLISEDIYDLECKIKIYLQKLYQKNFKSSFLSINCIYAYLNLVEIENKDIISIVEAVRYNINKEKILKKIE